MGLLSGLGTAGNLHAAVNFVFDYGSGSEGFNDPVLGPDRRSALEQAADTLGSWFGHDAIVHIDARSYSDPMDATLAYAGSSFSAFSGFRGYLTGIVGQKILSDGVQDLNGASADGELMLNFAHSWDLDDHIDPGSYDFKASVMHEMLHAVGFASGINGDGTDIWGAETGAESTPGGGTNGGIWAPFDNFVVDVNGTSVIDDSDYHLNLVNWSLNATGGDAPDGGLFFDGPNARAANDGLPVGLHTPSTFEPGSSVSHLDTTGNKLLGPLLMHSSSDTGPLPRELSEVERGVLQDLGYAVVPEPSSTLLILLGLTWLGSRRAPRYPLK